MANKHLRAGLPIVPEVHKGPKDSSRGWSIVAVNVTHRILNYAFIIGDDVLNKLNQVGDTALDTMLTMDVEALHTCKDHSDSLRALYLFHQIKRGLVPPLVSLVE